MKYPFTKPFVIAEIGSVHDGKFALAKKLIKLAADVGADAVKFQTHISAAETLRNAPMPPYFKGEPRYEYFERTGFTLEQWKKLKAHARKYKLVFLSSPFSEAAVDLLEQVGMPAYKIPSGEVTNTPLLVKIAKLKKPVLLSSGMSDWKELDQAVNTIKKFHSRIVVLQCTSAYPTNYKAVGLNVMQEMAKRYKVAVGLSDHTMTNYSAFAAVARGAVVIEKHLTISRDMYGSDAPNSLLPDEFRDLTAGVAAIGTMNTHPTKKVITPAFRQMKRIFEKSIVAARDLPKGHRLTRSDIDFKKPGSGIRADQYKNVVGKKLKKQIRKDNLFTKNHI